MDENKIVFRVHAVRRMFQRNIGVAEVRRILETGEVIESYPEDTPYPSRLLMGWSGPRPLHVVVAENTAAAEIVVITVYQPDRATWDWDFRRRR